MIDSRLKQAGALLDDARCLLVEIVDEGPHFKSELMADFNRIDAARQFINSAITYVNAADSDADPEEKP